jgi:hypothetical protein
MADSFAEKRRFPRLPAEHTVLVKRLGPGATEEFAKTQTVSLGGCRVVTDSSLGLGAGVELLISVRGGVVRAQGRVVYEIPKGDGNFLIGVEFLRMATGDLKLLQDLFAGQPEDTGV